MRQRNQLFLNYYNQDEIGAIDAVFYSELQMWENELLEHYEAVRDDFTFIFMPLLAFKAYQFLGVEQERALAMANMFKTTYFGDSIMLQVKDEEEGQEYSQEMQFRILISDYLFGKVLYCLVENDSSWLLGDFAEMMTEINEGFVMQHCLKYDYDTVLAKTRMPFYSTAFHTAARTAGLDPDSASLFRQIGHDLGMALELHAAGDARAQHYRALADNGLKSFNIRNRNCEHDLCWMIDTMAEKLNQSSPIAAVL